MKPQLFSGARAKLKIGNAVVAMCTGVSINESHSVRAVHTFGATNARSVEPLQVSPVSVSVERVVPVNAANGDAKDVSALALGIEPLINQLLKADDISIELTDTVTGATMANVKNCRFAGRSLSLSAGNLANERLQFLGIYDAGPIGANQQPQNSPTKLGF